MREIKFRVWNGESMLSHKDYQFLLFGDSGYQAFSNNLDGENEYTNSLESEEWVLMQYTGLKDKNGVEIYEGDILKCDFDDGDPAIGFVCWSNMEGGYIYNTRGCGICFNEFYAKRLSEVIGNIYENPEMQGL